MYRRYRALKHYLLNCTALNPHFPTLSRYLPNTLAVRAPRSVFGSVILRIDAVMRKRGSTFEYQKERDKDLLDAYRRQIAVSKHPIIRDDLITRTVNSPSKRFWVSGRYATFVVSKMMRGESLRGMRRSKLLMYAEIYRRVVELRSDPQHADEPLLHVVSTVVEQQAPCFYLTPGSAGVILSNIRRRAKRCVNARRI